MIDCMGGVGADLETVRAVLELLATHQIRFSSDSGLDLTAEAVLLRLRDPEGFEAWAAGGTVAQLRAWYAYDWKCRAHTRSKRRCRNWVSIVELGRFYDGPEPGPGELEGFRPHEPEFLFCRLHLSRLAEASRRLGAGPPKRGPGRGCEQPQA